MTQNALKLLMTPHVRIRIAIPTLAPAAARHRARPPADDARTEGQTVGQRRVRGRVEGESKAPDSGASTGAVALPHRFALVSGRPPATAATRRPITTRSPELRCAAPSQRSPRATHAATIAADADPALLVGAGGSIALLPVAAPAAALPPRRHAPRRRASPLPPPIFFLPCI